MERGPKQIRELTEPITQLRGARTTGPPSHYPPTSGGPQVGHGQVPPVPAGTLTVKNIVHIIPIQNSDKVTSTYVTIQSEECGGIRIDEAEGPTINKNVQPIYVKNGASANDVLSYVIAAGGGDTPGVQTQLNRNQQPTAIMRRVVGQDGQHRIVPIFGDVEHNGLVVKEGQLDEAVGGQRFNSGGRQQSFDEMELDCEELEDGSVRVVLPEFPGVDIEAVMAKLALQQKRRRR